MYIIKNLKKTYGGVSPFEALKGVHLEVSAGEFLAVMGPSGAGKTTLLNMLATIDQPTSGELYFKGAPISGLKGKALTSFRKKELGFVFQDFNLIDTMNVFENIALPYVIAGHHNRRDLEERVLEIATRLGIQGLLEKYPYQLSGGERQRTAVARALMNKPTLLLADEPTGNLDTKSARNFLELLQELHKDLGMTIVMVTHDPFVASYTNRVVFLRDGKTYAEMYKGSDRKNFYDRILDGLHQLGGIS